MCRRIRELSGRHVGWGRRLSPGTRDGSLVRELQYCSTDLGEAGCNGPCRAGSSEYAHMEMNGALRAEYPHHVWVTDFQFDQTMDGSTLKFLNVINKYSRHCLLIRDGMGCKAAEAIDTIEELLQFKPALTICVWTMARIHYQCCRSGVCERLQCGLHLTRFTIGKLFRELFNSRFKDEFLNIELFISVQGQVFGNSIESSTTPTDGTERSRDLHPFRSNTILK